jgi:hypothetical protein
MRLKLATYFLIALISICSVAGLAQEKLNAAQITRIILSSHPDITAEQISIGMIKSLKGRYKVNATIADREAVIFLTSQMFKGERRWYYEKSVAESIVYTDKKIIAAKPEQKISKEIETTEPFQPSPQAEIPDNLEPETLPLPQPQAIKDEPEAKIAKDVVQEEETLPTRAEMDIATPASRSTGASADVRQYIIALVRTLAKGDNSQYGSFLYRPSEIAKNVREKDYLKGIDIWKKQFATIHKQFQDVATINISKITLQSPQNNEIATSTSDRIRQTIKNVIEVITAVEVTLKTDRGTRILKLGGLVQTPGGWRISGTVTMIEAK